MALCRLTRRAYKGGRSPPSQTRPTNASRRGRCHTNSDPPGGQPQGAASYRADLRSLFNAASVALIGATERSQWSVYTYENLTRFSPDVEVHVVHPRHIEVHGRTAARSLSSLDAKVDLAYIMVPTSAVLDVVEEAADAGVTNLVVLTAGFAEAGEEGAALEAQLAELARRRGLTVLGPNGNGFINVARGVTPYGLPITPPLEPGPVGIVLQSGGLASAVLSAAQSRGIGVSLLCSTGNEAVTSATDIISYLVADEHTRVIAAFLESVRNPAEFRRVAGMALAAGKPIVALKTGRTAAGARAALAHTGALAGDDRVVDAAFRQLGVIRVGSLEEMLATAGYLGYHPGLAGRRIAAVTASGGACDLLADRASDEGLELPEFPPATLEDLQGILPAFSNPHNPLDVTGYVVVDPTLALSALGIVGREAEGRYDMIVYSTAVPRQPPANPALAEARMDAVAKARDSSAVPVVLQSSVSSDLTPYGRQLLSERGLYILDGIELGTRAIGHGARYHEQRARSLSVAPPAPSEPLEVPAGAHGVWSEHLTRRLLEDAGIPVVPALLVTSSDEALAAAQAFAVPVALKVASASIAHKSDVGGVRLGVAPAQAGVAYCELIARVGQARPDVTLDGVLVSPMLPDGVELLVGVSTDATWGKVLSVALGGVWVELLGDAAIRLLPASEADVEEMLASLRAAAVLRGARGTRGVDVGRLAEVVAAIGRLGEGLGDALDTLEVNPLWASEGSVEVLDALAIWAQHPSGLSGMPAPGESAAR